MKNKDNNNVISSTGKFLLLRMEQDLVTNDWSAPNEILEIDMYEETPSKSIITRNNEIDWEDRLLYTDYTNEQGITYKYCLQ